jgi:hypothetical protein
MHVVMTSSSQLGTCRTGVSQLGTRYVYCPSFYTYYDSNIVVIYIKYGSVSCANPSVCGNYRNLNLNFWMGIRCMGWRWDKFTHNRPQ